MRGDKIDKIYVDRCGDLNPGFTIGINFLWLPILCKFDILIAVGRG